MKNFSDSSRKFMIICVCAAAAIIIALVTIYAVFSSVSDGSKTDRDGNATPVIPSSAPGDELVSTPSDAPAVSPPEDNGASPQPSEAPDDQEAGADVSPSPDPAHEDNAPDTEASSAPSASPEPPAEPRSYTLSFAGSCCFNSAYADTAPLSSVSSLFAADDFSIINLQCVLTDSAQPVISPASFAPSTCGEYLVSSGVDFVSLANNRVMDCGAEGYADTVNALTDAGLAFIEDWSSVIYSCPGGLRIGLYASNGYVGSNIKKSIGSLRSGGADIVIACFNWNTSDPDDFAETEYDGAHYAADCGADIVFGQSADKLQYLERYNDSMIIYGLGTFINTAGFSGDCAVLQITLSTDDGNSFEISETACLPYASGSSSSAPEPLEPGSDRYYSVLSQLTRQLDDNSEPSEPDEPTTDDQD